MRTSASPGSRTLGILPESGRGVESEAMRRRGSDKRPAWVALDRTLAVREAVPLVRSRDNSMEII